MEQTSRHQQFNVLFCTGYPVCLSDMIHLSNKVRDREGVVGENDNGGEERVGEQGVDREEQVPYIMGMAEKGS